MSDLVLEVERWSGIWPECIPLMKGHQEEVRGGQDDRFPLDLDLERARELDRLGAAVIVSAREPEEFQLVGYLIWYLSMSLETKGLLTAVQSAWYLKPEWRGNGRAKELWDRSLEELKARGVQVVYPHHWTSGDGTGVGRFFERLGAVKREVVYELWIGD